MISKNQFVKALIGIILVNIIVITGIVVFVNNKLKNNDYVNEQGQEYANGSLEADETDIEDLESDEDDEELNPEIDREDALKKIKNQSDKETSYNQIFTSLLPGVYILEDGKSFSFTKTGAFNGYFNDENPDVTGYSYELSVDADKNIITISDPKKTQSVRYILEFEGTGIVLRVPDSDITYLLSNE